MSFFDDFFHGLGELISDKVVETVDTKVNDFCRLTGADRDDVGEVICDVCDALGEGVDKMNDFIDSL